MIRSWLHQIIKAALNFKVKSYFILTTTKNNDDIFLLGWGYIFTISLNIMSMEVVLACGHIKLLENTSTFCYSFTYLHLQSRMLQPLHCLIAPHKPNRCMYIIEVFFASHLKYTAIALRE